MPRHYFQCSEHSRDPAEDLRIESLAKLLSRPVGESSFLLMVARDFLVNGESIGSYRNGLWIHYDPSTVVIRDNKYYAVRPDGEPEDPIKPIWHCALNPVECRGVPFDPDTGDEIQAVQQFVADMKELYDLNREVIDTPISLWVTHTNWCRVSEGDVS